MAVEASGDPPKVPQTGGLRLFPLVAAPPPKGLPKASKRGFPGGKRSKSTHFFMKTGGFRGGPKVPLFTTFRGLGKTGKTGQFQAPKASPRPPQRWVSGGNGSKVPTFRALWPGVSGTDSLSYPQPPRLPPHSRLPACPGVTFGTIPPIPPPPDSSLSGRHLGAVWASWGGWVRGRRGTRRGLNPKTITSEEREKARESELRTMRHGVGAVRSIVATVEGCRRR